MTAYPLAPQQRPELKFLGLPLYRVGEEELHHFIEDVIAAKQKAVIPNLNIHCVNLALRHRWLRDFLYQSQLIFCDGDGVRWGVRCLGETPPPKVAFTRWIRRLAAFCEKKRYRLYFLGAAPGVAGEASEILKRAYPNLQIAGIRDGYFDFEGRENEEVVAQINEAKPDILIVCMGMPRQEQWIHQNAKRLETHILLPAGAVFDYVAGRLGRAPLWMVRWHLEWLFRITQEPKRLFWRYAYDIPVFFARILKEKIGRLIGRRSRKGQSESSS